MNINTVIGYLTKPEDIHQALEQSDLPRICYKSQRYSRAQRISYYDKPNKCVHRIRVHPNRPILYKPITLNGFAYNFPKTAKLFKEIGIEL